jgi:hypothetical protein
VAESIAWLEILTIDSPSHDLFDVLRDRLAFQLQRELEPTQVYRPSDHTYMQPLTVLLY